MECQNGGTCRLKPRNESGDQDVFCSCAPGFHGPTCSIDVCDDYCKHVS